MKTNKPRTHNPAWKDNTRTERQKQRRAKLNKIAQAAGFASWSKLETAALKDMIKIEIKV